MKKIKIEYNCFLNSSGYSSAAQDLILALYRSNRYDIKITPFEGKPARPAMTDERYCIFNEMIKKRVNLDAIQIMHCIPTIQRRAKKLNKNMAFATFETFQPPIEWIKILNENDGLITPSFFNYKIFAHAGIKKPIFHLPHCIDIEMYNNKVMPMKKHERFTFLFFGTWKKRKGHEQLIESWLKEFSDKDNVQLMIKTDKIEVAKKDIEKIKKQLGISKGFAPILFEHKILSEVELPMFLKSFDCLVIPTMGEGFCLPGLQSMALKVPVIITNFSGCQDYANSETSTLIEPQGFVLQKNMDSIPQFRNKKWAFISIKDLREKMRDVFTNYDVAKNKALCAYDYVRDNFNYNKIENIFYEMLGSVYGI